MNASWRLGCYVLCPDHGVLLAEPAAAGRRRGGFQGVKGRLQFACRSPVHPANDGKGATNLGWLGFATSGRSCGCTEICRATSSALAASPPRQRWGPVRSAEGRITAVRDLTVVIIAATQLKLEPWIELPEPRAGQPFCAGPRTYDTGHACPWPPP
jgi:hypothetical protein